MNQQIEQLQNRLLALEVGLKEGLRQGYLTAKDYAARLKALKTLRDDVDRIHLLTSFSDKSVAGELELGIPKLEGLSPNEKLIIGEAFERRTASARKLYKNLQTITDWVEDAARRRRFNFMTFWRLAKLKRLLGTVERMQLELNHEGFAINSIHNKLSETIKQNSKSPQAAANLSGLIEIFQDLDSTASRIAKLKTVLRKEENQLQQMQRWLNNFAALARQTVSPQLPPSAALTGKMSDILGEKIPDRITGSRDRLILARKFIKAYLDNHAAQELGYVPGFGNKSADADEPGAHDV